MEEESGDPLHRLAVDLLANILGYYIGFIRGWRRRLLMRQPSDRLLQGIVDVGDGLFPLGLSDAGEIGTAPNVSKGTGSLTAQVRRRCLQIVQRLFPGDAKPCDL